jgi:hypothetical protein
MALLCEVQGNCPLCRRVLILNKQFSKARVFDVAHIYPLNPYPHEILMLSGEEVLSNDIDCEENFIVLCKVCHKAYDTQKTVEEYRQLVEIKKTITRVRLLSETWDKQTLHKDISLVSEKISSMSINEIEGTILTYGALRLPEKKDDSLGIVNELKIAQLILHFFIPIRNALKSLEMQEKATSAYICSQVRSYYLALCLLGFDQSQIFEAISEWFMVNTGITDRSKAEVLVSFFIQNCEIYSEC